MNIYKTEKMGCVETSIGLEIDSDKKTDMEFALKILSGKIYESGFEDLSTEKEMPFQITNWVSYNDGDSYVGIEELPRSKYKQYEQFIIDEIVKNKYCFSGEAHQRAYCPVLNGKYVFRESQRGWGHVMAEAWAKIKGQQRKYRDYVKYYIDNWMDQEQKLPR